jgi:predicted secreted Zn-dependent protease
VKFSRRRALATFAVLLNGFYASFMPPAQPVALAQTLPDAPAIGSPTPDIQTALNYVYYDIAGTTESDIRNQISSLGPRDTFGTWGASTRWNVDWFYSYLNSPSGCSAGSVRVQLGVTITLPHWNVPGRAAPRLVANWQRFSSAVLVHEGGHRDLALEGANELGRALLALPPAPSCAELEQTARASGEAMVGQYNRLQLLYDQTTKHGATQGAVFP